MARRTLSQLTFAVALLAGAFVGMGCGVSPAYAPVRSPITSEPPPSAALYGEAEPRSFGSTSESEPAATEYEDTDPAALSDFHDVLSPYGSWEEDAAYGTVWVPAADRVGGDFAPYKTAGHWELDTNEDWLWVSDYDDSFGWVVFHYGRWVYTDARGWAWIPGRRYAPAWVAWQTGDPGYGYVGWAPMPPTYYWRGGSYFWLDVYPAPYFVYCPTSYVFYRDWQTHAVPRSQVVAVATPMHPHGVPRGGGHVYASPHHGPSRSSGYISPGSYPTSRHRMADVSRKYAVPPAGHSAPRAGVGTGSGLGGSPRAGSHSRPYSFDPPGTPSGASAFGSRTLGTTQTPGRPAATGPTGPSVGGAGTGPTRIAAPPTARGAFSPSSRPTPSAFSRGSSSGPTRMPSHAAPTRAPSYSAPSRMPSYSAPSRAPSYSAPSRAPSYSAPSRMPSYSAPSRAPSYSAPSRAPSSFSHSSSSSHSSARPSAPAHHSGGGARGRR
jgi:hypothetical protein